MNGRKVVKKLIPKNTFKKVEPYGHLAETVLHQTRQKFPAKGLKIIGVTGTNGKTTTCFMIHKMLSNAGFKVGLMTTVAYGVGEELHPQIAHMTTVSSSLLLKRLNTMKQQGAEWIVLETTSHALAQNRTWGIDYYMAVMTNLTHEHLDYHGTFENYRNAKIKMFKLANKNKQGSQLGVINADDENAKYFAKPIKNTLTYGIKNGDLRAKDVNLSPSGVSYTAVIKNDTYNINCQIPGSFNVYNSLAVVAVGRELGLTKKLIEQGIGMLTGVEGRMTKVDKGQNFDVIIDFAHTPDSFEKLFKDLKPVIKGKLIVLFGSAGRRDEAKRVIQGKLAGKYADVVVLTEEDDRDIDGNAILDQIASGAEEAGKVKNENLFLILDRSKAIEFALKQAKANDTVLLLGKGHEKTIERADGEHPWDEISLTKQLLSK
ncbi:UDP-N-acetylmuramoyl-L-alanyl-D-glutamate--2,6-diaminopimelate ligase [Candidatus Saccharibacteria bacterium]|nr:UDP-N-acetylmuramoyl-L-alanyl-D-glutamate--2,6-diaminopimelate ligase [Candidatus Saccharibacteria bacterium]